LQEKCCSEVVSDSLSGVGVGQGSAWTRLVSIAFDLLATLLGLPFIVVKYGLGVLGWVGLAIFANGFLVFLDI